MIEIDWTRPIRGAISHRPARLVCSDAGGKNPYVCLVKNPDDSESAIIVDSRGFTFGGGPYIENVPPPKKAVYVYGRRSPKGPHEQWWYDVRDEKVETDSYGFFQGLQYRLIETLSVDI